MVDGHRTHRGILRTSGDSSRRTDWEVVNYCSSTYSQVLFQKGAHDSVITISLILQLWEVWGEILSQKTRSQNLRKLAFLWTQRSIRYCLFCICSFVCFSENCNQSLHGTVKTTKVLEFEIHDFQGLECACNFSLKSLKSDLILPICNVTLVFYFTSYLQQMFGPGYVVHFGGNDCLVSSRDKWSTLKSSCLSSPEKCMYPE